MERERQRGIDELLQRHRRRAEHVTVALEAKAAEEKERAAAHAQQQAEKARRARELAAEENARRDAQMKLAGSNYEKRLKEEREHQRQLRAERSSRALAGLQANLERMEQEKQERLEHYLEIDAETKRVRVQSCHSHVPSIPTSYPPLILLLTSQALSHCLPAVDPHRSTTHTLAARRSSQKCDEIDFKKLKSDLEQQATLRKSIMVQGDLNIVERKAMLLQRKSGDVRQMLGQVARQGVDLKI